MSRDRVHTFFSDLLFDLRERRLILPVIALAVAVVAVPIALGGTEPAPPPASSPPPEAIETEPAVAQALESGVRTGASRLSGDEPTNPFRQQLRDKTPTGAIEGDAAAASGTTSTATAATASVTDPAASQQQAVDEIANTIASEVTGDQSQPVDGGSTPGVTKVVVEATSFNGDVRFGEVGDRKKYKNVKRFTLLPGEKNPVVFLAGFEAGGNRAVFTLDEKVIKVYEGGKCKPDRRECSMLVLEAGDTAKFKRMTGDGPVTYALTVRDINHK